MYIWIGCKLPEEFDRRVAEKCIPLGEKLGLDNVAFTLPRHISLKISFSYAGDLAEILAFLKDLFAQEPSFYVNPATITRQGNILWFSFRENARLQALHNRLDQQLQQHFAIPQHPFDRDFAYHSTLFFGAAEDLDAVKAALADFPLPQALTIEKILLGISETGTPGTYRVVEEISLK